MQDIKYYIYDNYKKTIQSYIIDELIKNFFIKGGNVKEQRLELIRILKLLSEIVELDIEDKIFLEAVNEDIQLVNLINLIGIEKVFTSIPNLDKNILY